MAEKAQNYQKFEDDIDQLNNIIMIEKKSGVDSPANELNNYFDCDK